MNLRLKSSGPRRPTVAMTLLEIMVAVSLLSLIVLTLYNMFDRTQKALRGTRNQTDIAEAGRAGLETLVREIQQMRAMSSTNPYFFNLYVDNRFSGNSMVISNAANPLQTNLLVETFFHNFSPQASPTNWSGIGYRVASTADPRYAPANGVGTLYRFVTNSARVSNVLLLNYLYATNATATNAPGYFQRVCDGVIHFNLKLYTNGSPVNNVYPFSLQDTQLVSHVEIELGLIPPTLLDQAKSFPLAADQMTFLSTKGDKVQMFRQLVPIQTVLR